jgi:hypothetical protein
MSKPPPAHSLQRTWIESTNSTHRIVYRPAKSIESRQEVPRCEFPRPLITTLALLLALPGIAHAHRSEGARVIGQFSTTHPFEWRGMDSTYVRRASFVQIGSFVRSETSVQYLRGPSVECGSRPCVNLHSLASRHHCGARGRVVDA